MSFPYQIIFCDLDGTLLDSRMELSDENAKAIHTLTQNGILFVPNSGRAFGEMPESIRKNPDIRYYICSDGTVIYDKLTGECKTDCLSNDVVNAVYDLLAHYDTYLSVHADNASYVERTLTNEEHLPHYQVSAKTREFLYDTNIPTDHFERFCRTHHKTEMVCAYFHSDEEREHCRQQLAKMGGLMTVTSIPHTLEIISASAGKGNTLLRFANHLGVDPKNTIALGDSGNDADMLRASGHGVAMKNAWDELKATADEVLPITNKEHVMRYLLERYPL